MPKSDEFEPFMPPTRKDLTDPSREPLKETLAQGGHTGWLKGLQQEDKVKDFKAGLTPDMLSQAKGSLKRVTNARTPWAHNLTISRDGENAAHTGAEFADFAAKTRRDLTTLAQTESGSDLFRAIDGASGKTVSIEDAGSAPGVREGARFHDPDASVEQHGALIDLPGPGSSATVRHHTDIGQRWGRPIPGAGISGKQADRVGMSGPVALGQELIHAAHAVHGHTKPVDSTQSVKSEERETVGHVDGRRGQYGLPTENGILQEMTRQVLRRRRHGQGHGAATTVWEQRSVTPMGHGRPSATVIAALIPVAGGDRGTAVFGRSSVTVRVHVARPSRGGVGRGFAAASDGSPGLIRQRGAGPRIERLVNRGEILRPGRAGIDARFLKQTQARFGIVGPRDSEDGGAVGWHAQEADAMAGVVEETSGSAIHGPELPHGYGPDYRPTRASEQT